MKRFVIFCLFLCVCSTANATSYYVKSGGNDSLSGLDDANAWATIAKVTATATSGDTVYFRSQDTWTSSSIPVLAATAGVTYNGAAYGSGTRATLTTTTTATGTPSHGVVDLYVSNTSLIGFNINGNEKSTGGIYIGYYAPTDTSYILVDNCIVHDNGGAEKTPTAFLYGIIIGQTLHHTVSNVTIANTTVYNAGHEGISVYPSRYTEEGMDESPNYVHDVLIRGCTVHDTAHWGGTSWGHGIDVGLHSDNVTIEYNTVYNTVGGVSLVTYPDIPSPGSPDNIIVRYNLIYNNSNSGFSIDPSSGGGYFGNTYFYGNILIDNGLMLGGNYNSTIHKIYNNTIYIPTESMYGIHFGTGSSNTSGIELKNNIIYTYQYANVKDEESRIIAHSNNLLYRAAGTLVITTEHNYTSDDLATWEATAQNTDPTFTAGTLPTGFSGTYGTNMVPNTTYFAITTGNALNNGATLGSPYNGCINGAGLTTVLTRPGGAAYDIGAYEYDPTTPSPTPTPGPSATVRSGGRISGSCFR